MTNIYAAFDRFNSHINAVYKLTQKHCIKNTNYRFKIR